MKILHTKNMDKTNIRQETQLMLTNQRDAFRSQSRSPNMAPFHFHSLPMCNSNFVFKTHRFSDIQLQKCRDIEIRVRGHSRSLKVVPDWVWLPSVL